MPIKIEADDKFLTYLNVFQENKALFGMWIVCQQMIRIPNQALFLFQKWREQNQNVVCCKL